MSFNKKKLFRWIKIIILLYSGIGLLIYFFQEKLLFHPVSLNKDYQYHFSTPFKEVNIQYDSNIVFNMIRFSPEDTQAKKGVVLYFHGNRENINRYAPYATNFTKHGYEVWMPDYPTFGKSTGELSEKMLQEVSLEVYKMAQSKFSKQQIVIYGKSLGTGIAAYLSTRKNCQQLILETPYSSITALFNRYCFIYPVSRMIKYKIPTVDYIKNTIAPITIFQASNDWVIPNSNTRKLKKVLKPTDTFITINKASHNNINDFQEYHLALDKLLQ
ncbi:MAG: alpha/beta fold hydrolase [Chitinophagaceae bacterium]|nr:alpha/beta fold hydrolase [Chitinophagaceae bacterium]MCW5906135.1 alpha/beta fold hydrolase [Chitinophagaceae bacterium]